MSDREHRARDFAARTIGAVPTAFAQPFAVLASPAWRGIEGDIWRAEADGRAVVVKHYHPDTAFYTDPAGAITAARHAAAAGVGPAVLLDDAAQGLVAFEALGMDWRCGGLHDVVAPPLRRATIAAKKTFQQGPRLGRDLSIFDEIRALAALAASAGAATHPRIETFLSVIGEGEGRIGAAGVDRKPCHRDGNTANLMVGPDGQVMLVDFDLSADCDPYEDLGCWLVEAFDTETAARAGFEEWDGHFDEGLFRRAMLYGMADDLRWGLIGSILSATSARRSLEFAKYACWRFLRLSTMALGPLIADRLRRLA